MTEYRLRPFEPADRSAIEAIHRECLFMGHPLPFPIVGLEDQLRLFTDYYLDCEPELATVAVDQSDRLVGYLLGCVKPAQQGEWQRRRALALGLRWLREWPTYDPFTRLYFKLRILDAWEVIANPSPELPAHMHWSILPEARNCVSLLMVAAFAAQVRERGIPEFGGEMFVDEKHLNAHFERLGGEVRGKVKHHTFSILAGQPIWRITLVSQPRPRYF
jgi:hypothetical protein